MLVRSLQRFFLAAALSALLLYGEGTRTLAAAAREVAGEWETFLVAREVPAIAILAFMPFVAVVIAYATMVPLLDARRGRVGWGVAMSMIAAAFAFELSTGRKAHVTAVRAPFVAAMVVVAFVMASVVAPRARAFARGRPWAPVLLGALVIAASVVADARVLPRLYPVFHHGLIACAAIGVVLVADGVIDAIERLKYGHLALYALSIAGAYMLVIAAMRVPRAGPALAKYDNARRIADERSVILARAVEIAARRWPPPPLEEPEGAVDPLVESGGGRALDAKGRDLLLITIDALRADHLGAYGYARPTTPKIDALAAEGLVFEHAYTATPHTSYAITSLMTGKYMRPIVALEAAAGGGRRPDETWAGLLRTYGFRTAAFFPPAVWAVDGDRFVDLQKRNLDFEYAWIEFGAPDLYDAYLGQYLATAPKDKPLFLWVHLFEPHEPYVAHPEHPFGEGEIDRYDSEIAAADDGVGKIVARVRTARPGTIVMVSADHGEAFGEHGARYHGTTVYEEQVRVPLIVSAPGLVPARRETRPVQLVDLLPTVLAAYDIPKPPRVRGRDLGRLFAGKGDAAGKGIAFAEVEDAAMLAEGDDRLICNRKVATCALYDVAKDPHETSAVSDPAAADRMRRDLGALVAASAKLEGFSDASARGWPDALRRAFAGDATAAPEVAMLLDDVDVAYRRRAAEVLARLARPETEPSIKRALGHETDVQVRRWLAIARLRVATTILPASEIGAAAKALEESGARGDFAALALSEGIARKTANVGPETRFAAFDRLVAWLPTAKTDGELARAIIAVLPQVRPDGLAAKRATPALLDALDDVRLRVVAAEALGLLGDRAAAPKLDERLATSERHQDARVPEAIALARLGEGDRALAHLARFMGVPEVPPGAAAALPLMEPFADTPHPWFALAKKGELRPPKGASHRIVVGGANVGATVDVKVNGVAYSAVAGDGGAVVELGDKLLKRDLVSVDASTTAGTITSIAVVARVDDLPPPKAPHGTKGDAPAPEPHAP